MKLLLTYLAGVDFSTVIAVLALLVSLFVMFLTARQVSLLRRQLQLDSLIKINEANRDIICLGFDKPELWTIVADSPEILNPQKAEERKRYLQLWFNHMQVIWSAHELGLIDKDEWIACREDIAEFLRIRALRTHWSEVRMYYSTRFQRFLDSLIADLQRTGKQDQLCNV